MNILTHLEMLLLRPCLCRKTEDQQPRRRKRTWGNLWGQLHLRHSLFDRPSYRSLIQWRKQFGLESLSARWNPNVIPVQDIKAMKINVSHLTIPLSLYVITLMVEADKPDAQFRMRSTPSSLKLSFFRLNWASFWMVAGKVVQLLRPSSPFSSILREVRPGRIGNESQPGLSWSLMESLSSSPASWSKPSRNVKSRVLKSQPVMLICEV